ncbi:MAG TPA: DNA translocase FtsK [Pyrinomonadaceae bacterium]|jgi:S-DNA-T family DNA segregation ATPase FtsK/SpoIIIE|nr:DNA translocase FtsK [Pyrinomonadaceae bacterium]
MAITQTDVRAKAAPPKNTRRNEIIAIALFALGALLTLCLVSAAFYPNDPSWNLKGASETHNLAGAIGAWVAAAFFQTVGLASYLGLGLLFIAAWQRFRRRHIDAAISRIGGSLILVLAVAALLVLFGLPAQFDKSVPPGGLFGAIIEGVLEGGLNKVGAGVVLFAAAAIGLLLATNFSFVHAYERLTGAFGNRFIFFRTLPERFNAWRARRKELAQERMELRRAAQLEREMAREIEKEATKELTAAERVAQFMNENPSEEIRPDATTAIKRSAGVSSSAASSQSILQPSQQTTKESEQVSLVTTPLTTPLKTSSTVESVPAQGKSMTSKSNAASNILADDMEDEEDSVIAEMVSTVSVVRTDALALEKDTLSSPSMTVERSRRTAAATAVATAPITDYRMPEVGFLNAAPPHSEQADEELRALAILVAEKFREFNVTGKIEYICPGPVVTTYEFKPDPGVKYSRVTGLVEDLCLALKAESIRIDRVPGKAHVGIEVPNARRETIHLREVIESRQFRESNSKLTIALGKTIDGLNYVADLAKMPHLLIAGSTGAGKSVGVNSLIVSILYKARPDEVKFIMVDPKRLELGLYADIPHLATPIITDPKRASIALKWAVKEMEDRYKRLAGWAVRNIDGFNTEVARRNLVKDYDEVTGEPHQTLPYIIIIIDELADLMMVSGHEVEESITRLAQMARAVGIHLVLATQRPSVDVITGLIKANFPSRISYRVSSKVDSRTIIDANGAEQLLGRGDMLFLPPGTSRLVRVHGAYVDEAEIGRIVSHTKAQGQPAYDESITQTEDEALGLDGTGGERDELFEDALRICVEMKRASTSVLQRRLRIGYGRAAAILDMMEREGFIGQADGARPRPVLSRAFEFISERDEQIASGG